MRNASSAKEPTGAPVIPLRASEASDAAALEQAVGAPSGRGRAVLLAIASADQASTLLRRARARSSDTRRCIVVAADRFGADGLASRILSGQCNPTPPAPRAMLRAWVAHLASQGHELTVALEDPGRLSLDAASWLGQLVRASRGAVRLLIPWARDARIWRVIEELGLETEVVGVTAPPPHSEPDESPPQAATSPSALPDPPRASIRTRRPLLVAGLIGLGLLGVGLWSYLPGAPQRAPDTRDATNPLASRAVAPPVAPAPASGRYEYDARTGRISFDVREEPLTRVLSELSAQLGFELRNLATDPLSQPVSLRVAQAPLEEALRALLHGYAKSFVYASSVSASEAPRLRTLIILPAPPEPSGAVLDEPAASAGLPGSTRVAREVESTLDTLLSDASADRRSAAIDRLLALDRAAVADELVRQFDELAAVGPLAPTRVDQAWEQLRGALCASADAREALPPELGCRPSSSR